MARFRIKCIIFSYVTRNSLECINMVQVVPETAEFVSMTPRDENQKR